MGTRSGSWTASGMSLGTESGSLSGLGSSRRSSRAKALDATRQASVVERVLMKGLVLMSLVFIWMKSMSVAFTDFMWLSGSRVSGLVHAFVHFWVSQWGSFGERWPVLRPK